MKKQLQIIRWLLAFFMVSLLLSGFTAIPVEWELRFLLRYLTPGTVTHRWITKVAAAYQQVNKTHPFLLYGYDWLAFAHFILAILFIGPYRDPVRNIWVVQFSLIACILIFPLAFIAGSFKGIPIGWRLIDCSFGVFGAIPLWFCYVKAKKLSVSPHYSTK